MKKILFLILVLLIPGMMSSCSETDKDKISKEEFLKQTVSEQVDYIFKCFADTNTVSRMLEATPAHILQIQEKRALPSPHFKKKLNNLGLYYIDSEYNNPKTLREFDPDYSWYDKIWDMDSLYGWYWFWIGVVVLVILSALAEHSAPIIIGTGFWLLCGLMSFISFCNSNPIEKENISAIEIHSHSSNEAKSNGFFIAPQCGIKPQYISIIHQI